MMPDFQFGEVEETIGHKKADAVNGMSSESG